MADHVENLNKLRKALVERRRDLVATWVKRKPLQFRDRELGALDEIRNALEAIEEAIKEEQRERPPKKRAGSPDFTTDPDA
jgi:hypothetical protein